MRAAVLDPLTEDDFQQFHMLVGHLPWQRDVQRKVEHSKPIEP